jgi:uncharacterized protein YcbX
MLGEELPGVTVTARGLAGDRRLALVHRATGKIVSAKNPHPWRDMLKLSAATDGTDVKIMLPNGTAIASADPGVDAALSDFLGQPVTLPPPRRRTRPSTGPHPCAGVYAQVPRDGWVQAGDVVRPA